MSEPIVHKCQGCDKVGPPPDTGTEPGALYFIDCQGPGDDWRQPVVCRACIERLSMDLWISKDCWDRIDPVIPYADLKVLE